MRIVPIGTESFGANTYLIISGHEALVVDPALSASAILEAIRAEDAQPVGILLTHGHFDHVLALDTLRAAYPMDAYLHEADAELLPDGRKNAFSLFFHKERAFGAADRLFRDGDVIPLGKEEIRVLHTPGHTPGSSCFLCGDFLVTGDTLFADTYGRCDLWGGSQELLCASLASLRALDGRMMIYPGHGQPERLGNALDSVAYLL
jgi:glyoxylase-like metal-dependent hydrolase (beta-lactamase superfamily II)